MYCWSKEQLQKFLNTDTISKITFIYLKGEEGMATHSSMLAQSILWSGEPGGL